MEDSQFKRNIIALVVAVPIIAVLSFLTSLFDNGSAESWEWHWQSKSNPYRVDNSLKQLVDLGGKWQFTEGDDLEWANADFDDSSWESIHVPRYWEGQGHENYDGFAWYRNRFSLEKDSLGRILYAELGQIDDADEVFINGKRIGGHGQFPPTYVGAYNQARKYAIPLDVIHEGENVIAVRVYDAQQGGGIYNGNIGIYISNLPTPLVNLEGEWEFAIEGEEESTRTIQVPGAWEHQGVEKYDGLARYKKTIGPIAVKSDETLVLLLGKIDDTDEVFLNGKLIGRTGNLDKNDRKVDPDYHKIERVYEFSGSLLNETNILEVRVHDSGGIGGIYEGPVSIVTKSAYREYKDK